MTCLRYDFKIMFFNIVLPLFTGYGILCLQYKGLLTLEFVFQNTYRLNKRDNIHYGPLSKIKNIVVLSQATIYTEHVQRIKSRLV